MRRSLLLLLCALPLTAHASVCGGLNPVLVSTTAVAFGNYDASASSANNANGTVTIYCTVQTGNTLPSFTIALNGGGANSFSPRHMNLLTATLNYNLFTNSAHSIIWGDGTGSTQTQSYNTSSNVATKSFTIFGSIPANQYVTLGLYGDTVTVTVTY